VTQVLPGKTGKVVKEGTVLEIRDLHVNFRVHGGVVRAVRGLNLTIPAGRTVGLVGESGCGKSVSALSIMRLLEKNATVARGEIKFRGKDLLKLPEPQMQQIRGNDISMIFQEPMTALNPVFSVGDQIAESVEIHQLADSAEARKRAITLLQMVGIADAKRLAKEYPHELSGGMRQRVMIAMALACDPDLLIADEPTTALDVTIQAQILQLMRDLKSRTGAAILLITHDLGVVAEMCDDVAVMYGGRIVEHAPTKEIYSNPKHPYTVGLLESIPRLHHKQDRLHVIRGNVPNPLTIPPGCSFHPRCPKRFEPCDQYLPSLANIEPDHQVSCFLYPEVEKLEDKEIVAG
jgi:oligopeptide/dipeptide ABC transporter ATP-binding protein